MLYKGLLRSTQEFPFSSFFLSFGKGWKLIGDVDVSLCKAKHLFNYFNDYWELSAFCFHVYLSFHSFFLIHFKFS